MAIHCRAAKNSLRGTAPSQYFITEESILCPPGTVPQSGYSYVIPQCGGTAFNNFYKKNSGSF